MGKGAFGLVAKVRMKYGTLFRAVKIIKETASLKEEVNRKKILAEISIPTELDHPNIAKLYEVYEYKNTLALVMELCEGGDLFTFIRANRIFT
jgi:calcium-dependent protein kinase